MSKIALIIACGKYTSGFPLRGPSIDARNMEAVCKNLGFVILKSVDQGKAGIEKILSQFEKTFESYNVRLVYYSGHGAAERNGENFLLPCDFPVEGILDVK